MRGYILILLCLGTTVHAATLTATLKPGTIKQGDSAILTVRCEGYELATVDPERTPSGMGFSFRGREKQLTSLDGADKVSVTFTYLVTTSKPGGYVVPAFTAKLPNGDLLRSEPLTFTVLDRDEDAVSGRQPNGFIKVQIDESKVFLGQSFSVTMELFVLRLLPSDLPVPQLTTPG
ncbi:MAG: hypothetical protein HOK62_02675, partial [Verrucomicrobiales bacterium]|nr:hypothetical protein [Verrucomicrobiales bacterium]